MMYIFLCTFFQGTDDTVGDSFAPLGPALLSWKNCMGRGHIRFPRNRGPDRSGSCLILIWQLPDQSGSCLILPWWLSERSGSCLIFIGSNLIDQAAAWFWSGSNLTIQATAWFWSGSSLTNQEAAWFSFFLIFSSLTCSNPANEEASSGKMGPRGSLEVTSSIYFYPPNLEFLIKLGSLPDRLIFWAGPKILLMQIRQPSQPDQSCYGKSGTPSQPDQSCSGKSGDQANKGILWEV